MQSSVDICVATYKRPQLLANLLGSLARQSIRGGAVLRIIVVDNDISRSAEEVVGRFREESGMDVVYEVEPSQGISFARNRALSHVNAHLVAFIDDDEEASVHWLQTLLDAMEKFCADVVFGPVIAVLPATAPRWARNHPSFHRARRPTGTPVEHGGSGNVLCKSYVFSGLAPAFDESFALTGGEDTELFQRLSKKGRALIWCDEAEVVEHASDARLTTRWVCARAYRGGQTYFRIYVASKPFPLRMLWLGMRAAAILATMAALPFLALLGSDWLVVRLSRLCGWLGQLSQGFGGLFEYEEYGRGEPRG